MPCEKVCEVVWGTEDQQSLRKITDRFRTSFKIIELFRNGLVLYLDVPEKLKPLISAQGRIEVGSDPGRVVVRVGPGMV